MTHTLLGFCCRALVQAMSDIDHLVSSAEALYQRAFPALKFLEPRPVDLRIDRVMSVSALRVELPSRSCLHIHSIALLGESGAPLHVDASVEASSFYGPAGPDGGASRVLDWEGSHSFSVHTEMEVRPWVEVSFREPVSVRGVLLRNRSGVYARRAAGMSLSALVSGKWVHLHDDVEEADRLAVSLIGLVNRGSPVVGALEAAAEAASAALASRYEGMDRLLSAHRLAAAEVAEVKRAINRHVLYGRQLEWTSHGVRRSFRFWSDQESAGYVGLAVRVCSDLQAVSPDVCFGFGSVLAIVRDAALIKHDDDLDVIVAFEATAVGSLRKALELVRDALVARGYRVQGSFLSHWHVMRDGKKVDVFVGLFEEGEIGWFPGRRRAFVKSDVFPARLESFLGFDCPVPRDAEKYLQELYGPNWRMPIPGWRHDWDRSAYLDLA